ncbi:hypothetical protein PV416_02215 [Streptomyces ipomoeae]|uniref:hypothetical protein n=1 Tax=Streptomyces ipomoeae TaxID=103232 RepID=UPI0029BB450D|nr:hypothetical protein [Streptomyces ipomoeae]MDX2819917.1 hypothetical protein [Streptomyces ipomoeae]MDX2872638.1 hypothetical protein [Streptomyces ipomoeae]
MFHRIRRRRAEAEMAEILRKHAEFEARIIANQRPPHPAQPATASEPAAEPAPVMDDFLPPELRVPSHDQVEGRMMPWPWPVVLDDEVVACTECATYRDWLIISTRGQVWLRCRAGHQQLEPRLDTAWFNRHSGPSDATHATFEDCLRHLGH